MEGHIDQITKHHQSNKKQSECLRRRIIVSAWNVTEIRIWLYHRLASFSVYVADGRIKLPIIST
jgi:thymidylate synthase